jgi:hypothetical protein
MDEAEVGTVSQAVLLTRFEAESCTYTGATLGNEAPTMASASAGQYVDGGGGANLSWTVNSQGGSQTLSFRLTSPSGARTLGVFVNGTRVGALTSTAIRPAWAAHSLTATLVAGNNTVELRDSEGALEPDVDYLEVNTASNLTRFEAEVSTYSNAFVGTDAPTMGTASSGQFVDNNPSAVLSWTLNSPGGTQPLRFSTTSYSGARSLGVFVDGTRVGAVTTTSLRPNWAVQSVSVNLSPGNHAIELRDSEGTSEPDVDYFEGNASSNLTRFEAESSTYTNSAAGNDPTVLATASAGQYVDGNAGATMSWTVSSPGGNQALKFATTSPSGARTLGVFVNGNRIGAVTTTTVRPTWAVQTLNTNLLVGNNTIELRDSEGAAEPDVDYLETNKALGGGGGGAPLCTVDSNCPAGQVCGNGTCMVEAPLFRNQGGASDKSFKRGIPFHFCGWSDSRGAADLNALKSGVTWAYNWGAGPLSCNDPAADDSAHSVKTHPSINNFGDAVNGVEWVPMVWGFNYGASHPGGITGSDCADTNSDQIPDGACFRVDNDKGSDYCFRSGGPCTAAGDIYNPGNACYECLHEKVTYQQLLDRIPRGSRYLLCGNEPNFFEQGSMSPKEFATMWKYCEKVAQARNLKLVAPAVNYCGPVHQGGGAGAGECIPNFNGREPQLFAWTDEFLWECEAGKNGRGGSGNYTGPNVGNCKVDYNAEHVYSADSSQTWVLQKISGWKNGTDAQFSVRRNADAFVAAQAAKPHWLTEFTPEWTGVERNVIDRMNDNLNQFEQSADMFRYAWFMLRVSPGMTALDQADLACATASNTSTITNAGKCYTKHPVGHANDPLLSGYAPECDYASAPPAQQTYCCADNYYGLCVNGMIKNCTTSAECDGNTACIIDGGSKGACMAKTCTSNAQCASNHCVDLNLGDPWPGNCRP